MVTTPTQSEADGGPHGAAARPDEAAQRLVLELAVAAGGIGTFDWDLVSGRLMGDQRLLDMFGLPRNRSVLHIDELYEAVHPADRDRVEALPQQAVDQVGVYDAEHRVVLPDGGIRWIAARGQARAGPDGRTVRLLGAAQDTTARRDAAAHVARVMDSLPTVFFLLDRHGRFAYVNAEAQRRLTRPADELLGRVIWDEPPAAQSSDVETSCRHAIDRDEPVAFDAYCPKPLNAWYEVRAWPSPEGLAVCLLDVNDRRQAHAAAQLHGAPAEPLAARALQASEMQLISRHAAAVLAATFPPGPAAEPLLADLAPESAVVVPLRGNTQPVGMLLLCAGAARGGFSDDDLELVGDIAARAGVVLDRARLDSTTIATVVTAHLQPIASPPGAGRRSGGAVDAVWAGGAVDAGRGSGGAVGAVWAGRAGGGGRLRFSNAGHLPPLLIAPDGTVTVLGTTPADPLLGVGPVPRHEHHVHLPPGSTVLFYTDGLVERRGQPLDAGLADLRRLLRHLAGSGPDTVCDAVLGLLPDRPEDDVALLAVQVTGA